MPTTNIPESEEIARQQKLLEVHRRTLAHYLRQQKILGVLAPSGLTNGIYETWESIHQIKTILRAIGVEVINHPDDEPRKLTSAVVNLSASDRRNRSLMLARVCDFWVKGVLENSLHNAVLINLGLVYQPEAVASAYPWGIAVQRFNNQHDALLHDPTIVDAFDDLHGQILILGAPGSGKTTLLLELARVLIARAEENESHPLPVVFNLSSWARKQKPLAVWLVDMLQNQYQVPAKIAWAWVKNNQILPLLDGLDEVMEEHRALCVAAINKFIQHNGLEQLVVCSRIEEYEILRSHLNLQGAVELRPLTSQQIDDYFARVGPALAAVRASFEHDATIRELVQSPLMLNILTLAYRNLPRSDLPHSTGIEEHRRHLFATYVQRMFERPTVYRVYTTLTRAVTEQRGTGRSYSGPQTIRWLSWLARGMAQQSQSSFLIEQLQADWLPTRELRRQYVIIDRLGGGLVAELVGGVIGGLAGGLAGGLSGWLVGGLIGGLVGGLAGFLFGGKSEAQSPSLQGNWPSAPSTILRWLIAAIVKQQTKARYGSQQRFWGSGGSAILGWLAGMLIGGLVFGLSGVLDSGLAGGLVASLFGMLVGGLIGALVGGLTGPPSVRPRHIAIVDTLHFSRLEAKRAAESGKYAGQVVGMVGGLIFGLVSGLGDMSKALSDGLFARVASGLLGGLIMAVILGWLLGGLLWLVFGVAGGLSSGELREPLRPNQGIWRSARNAILGGISVGLVFGLSGGLLFGLFGDLKLGLSAGLGSGMLFGLVGTLVYGGYACISHVALRLVLWGNGAIPWNYARFLDYATDRIFLRKVGGGYIFVHRLLLEYFADLEDKPDYRVKQPDCYRYLLQRSNSSLKCIIWPVGTAIMTHFRRHSRRFSPFSSRPENTGNSQVKQRVNIRAALLWPFLAGVLLVCATLYFVVISIQYQSTRYTAGALYRQAGVSFTAGNLDQAIREYTSAIDLQPETGMYYYARGYTQREAKNYPAALADLTEAIELQPEESTYFYWRGYTYWDMQNDSAALTDFAKAVELKPEEPFFLNSRCWFGSLAGRVAEVVDNCEHAVKLAPADGDIRDSRGLARALSGDIKGAIEDFTFFVEWSRSRNNEPYSLLRSKREAWITELKAGKNPFDSETLKRLRDE